MPKSEIDIKIINSPFQPNLEISGDLVLKLHAPYSDKHVTIQINPNIVNYEESPVKNVKHVSMSTSTFETKTLQFDFLKNKIQKLRLNDKNYEIELIDIGKINQSGQDFPTFHFKVREF